MKTKFGWILVPNGKGEFNREFLESEDEILREKHKVYTSLKEEKEDLEQCKSEEDEL